LVFRGFNLVDFRDVFFISFSLFRDKEKGNEAKKKKTRGTDVYSEAPFGATMKFCVSI